MLRRTNSAAVILVAAGMSCCPALTAGPVAIPGQFLHIMAGF